MNEYALDTARTRVGFVAAHRVGSKVHGQFNAVEGAVRLNEADPAASEAWITVRTDSIDTGNPKRDAQLSKEFLRTATHPEMTFVTTRIVPVSDNRYDVTGNLTLRGTTQPLTASLVVDELDDSYRFKASLTINRHTWNANWNKLTTALVHPTVQLDLDLVATPNP